MQAAVNSAISEDLRGFEKALRNGRSTLRKIQIKAGTSSLLRQNLNFLTDSLLYVNYDGNFEKFSQSLSFSPLKGRFVKIPIKYRFCFFFVLFIIFVLSIGLQVILICS